MGFSFVEFETASDLKIAVEKLDNQEFKGANVRCEADVWYPHSLTLLLWLTSNRLKMKFHAMIAIVLDHRHPSVEEVVAIRLLTGTMVADPLHLVVIALVVMTTVVVHHLHVTTTILVMVAIALHLPLVPLVLPLTMLIPLLEAATGAMIPTERRLLDDMMTPTQRMGMIDLGRDLHRERTGDTTSVHRRDTGECSPSH